MERETGSRYLCTLSTLLMYSATLAPIIHLPFTVLYIPCTYKLYSDTLPNPQTLQ